MQARYYRKHPNQLTPEEVATLRRYKGELTTVGTMTLEVWDETYGNRTLHLLRAWRGKALKPVFYFSYTKPELRTAKIEYVSASEQQHAEWKADRKACQAKARQALKDGATPYPVGTILDHSWGWEQTNVDFYQVIEAKGCKIVIRKIKQDTEETQFMAGHTTPRPGEFVGEPIVKRLQPYNEGYSIPFEHGWCDKWNGQPQRCSWYA